MTNSCTYSINFHLIPHIHETSHVISTHHIIQTFQNNTANHRYVFQFIFLSKRMPNHKTKPLLSFIPLGIATIFNSCIFSCSIHSTCTSLDLLQNCNSFSDQCILDAYSQCHKGIKNSYPIFLHKLSCNFPRLINHTHEIFILSDGISV